MLGEQVYEGKGKITGTRVIELDIPKIENSYTMQSKLKGIEVQEMGTFTATMRSADGVQYGEDKAVLMAPDGSGTTMAAHGIGRHTGPGKISFRGFAIASASGTGRLAAINNIVVAFEAEVDGDNLSVKGWEWK